MVTQYIKFKWQYTIGNLLTMPKTEPIIGLIHTYSYLFIAMWKVPIFTYLLPQTCFVGNFSLFFQNKLILNSKQIPFFLSNGAHEKN